MIELLFRFFMPQTFDDTDRKKEDVRKAVNHIEKLIDADDADARRVARLVLEAMRRDA